MGGLFMNMEFRPRFFKINENLRFKSFKNKLVLTTTIFMVLLLTIGAFQVAIVESISEGITNEGATQTTTVLDENSVTSGSYILNPTTTRAGASDLFISEVMFDPLGSDSDNEWITIYNRGNSKINLNGYTLTNGDGLTDVILPNWDLLPLDSLVVHLGWGMNDQNNDDFILDYYTQSRFDILDNDADCVGLFNADLLVDIVAWDAKETVTVTKQSLYKQAILDGLMEDGIFVDISLYSEGAALGRKFLMKNGNLTTEWSLPKLLINEVLIAPENPALESEYVELHNPGTGSIIISGWTLRTVDNTKYALPDVTIPPKSFILVNFEDSDFQDQFSLGTHDLNLKLGQGNYLNNNAGGAGLYDGSGNIVDFVAWAKTGNTVTGSVLDDAIAAAIWTSGEAVDITSVGSSSIGRDAQATESDSVSDWAGNGGKDAFANTPGHSNKLMVYISEGILTGADPTLTILYLSIDHNFKDWILFNGQLETVYTFPDLDTKEDYTYVIHFSSGTDLDDTENATYHHYTGSSINYNSTFDVLFLCSGAFSIDNTVDYAIVVDGEIVNMPTSGSRGNGEWRLKKDSFIGYLYYGTGANELVDEVKDTLEYIWEGIKYTSKELCRAIGRKLFSAVSKVIKVFDLSYLDVLKITAGKEGTDPFQWKLELNFPDTSHKQNVLPYPLYWVISMGGRFNIMMPWGSGQVQDLTTGISAFLSAGVGLGYTAVKIVELGIEGQMKFTFSYPSDAIAVDRGHYVDSAAQVDVDFQITASAKIAGFGFSHPWTWNIWRHTWEDQDERPEEPDLPDTSEPGVDFFPGTDQCCSGELRITNTDSAPHQFRTVARGEENENIALDADPESEGMQTYDTTMVPPNGTTTVYYRITRDPGEFNGTFIPEFVDVPENITLAPGNSKVVNVTIRNNYPGPIGMDNLSINITAIDDANYTTNFTFNSTHESWAVLAYTENDWPTYGYLDTPNGRTMQDQPAGWKEGDRKAVGEFRNMNGERTVQLEFNMPENGSTLQPERYNISVYSNQYPYQWVTNYSHYNLNNTTTSAFIHPVVQENKNIVYQEDFEGDVSEWNMTGDWEVGLRSNFTDSPASDDGKIAATGLNGNYTDGNDSWLSSPELDLSGHNWLNLKLWMYFDFSWNWWVTYNGNNWDYAAIYIKNENGLHLLDAWNFDSTYLGMLEMLTWWQNFTYDITPFASEHNWIVFQLHSINESLYKEKYGYGFFY